MANVKANGKAAKALQTHDYTGQEAMETNIKGTKNFLASPGKAPVPLKKSKGEEPAISAETNVILAAVENLRTSFEEFRGELKQNTLAIANLVKTVEFNSGEIKDLKGKLLPTQRSIRMIADSTRSFYS